MPAPSGLAGDELRTATAAGINTAVLVVAGKHPHEGASLWS
jgi:hypothetical protein